MGVGCRLYLGVGVGSWKKGEMRTATTTTNKKWKVERAKGQTAKGKDRGEKGEEPSTITTILMTDGVKPLIFVAIYPLILTNFY